jgi:hypothetical protein
VNSLICWILLFWPDAWKCSRTVSLIYNISGTWHRVKTNTVGLLGPMSEIEPCPPLLAHQLLPTPKPVCLLVWGTPGSHVSNQPSWLFCLTSPRPPESAEVLCFWRDGSKDPALEKALSISRRLHSDVCFFIAHSWGKIMCLYPAPFWLSALNGIVHWWFIWRDHRCTLESRPGAHFCPLSFAFTAIRWLGIFT